MAMRKKYTHFPFTIEDRGIRATASENGQVTITQDTHDGEYDEVIVPASIIFKLSYMLNASKKVTFEDDGLGSK